MNQFEKLAAQLPFNCDVCGATMLAMWGGGWDNDRIVCSDGHSCGAEIVFATSTPVEEDKT